MLNKNVQRNLALAFSFFCAVNLCRGQGSGPTVEVPTSRSALIDLSPNPDNNDANSLTMAGEYKSTKNVVEPEKPVFWTWYTDFGYESEYNFRGTNLTPNSDGAIFGDVRVTKGNFTLGLFGIDQLGNASSPSWSVGESGGAGSGTGANATCSGGPPCPPSGFAPYLRKPTTIQKQFNEFDVFLSYKMSFGPLDVTVGNIGFFISRRAETFEKDIAPLGLIWNIPDTDTRVRVLGPEPTLQDETFDRVYITLSTTKLSKYVTPQITYYQTLYSEGHEPEAENIIKYAPVFTDALDGPGFPSTNRPSNPRPNDERNEALGGYLEGRINGHIPITKWLDFDPYTILSVSFRDRAEPGGTSAETASLVPFNPRNGSGIYGAHPLTGWNHFQAGVELPIHLLHLGGSTSTEWAPPDAHLFFVPFGAYAYHIANPTPGTERSEWWGGAKFELTF